MKIHSALIAGSLVLACASPTPSAMPSATTLETASPEPATPTPRSTPVPSSEPSANPTPSRNPPSPQTPSAPGERGSVFCNGIELTFCLANVAKAAAAADPPFTAGAAVVVDYEYRSGWGSWWVPLIVVEVPANWQTSADLRAWVVDQDPPPARSKVEAYSPSRLPGYVVEELPHGGPWNGAYAADTLVVSFEHTASPADAGRLARAAGLEVLDWQLDDTPPGQTIFDSPKTDAGAVRAVLMHATPVCEASLFRFDHAFNVTPIDQSPACRWPAPDLALRVSGMAMVVAGGNTALVRTEPGFLSPSVIPAVPEGVPLYVVDGPVQADGANWWLVEPEYYDYSPDWPFGWVAERSDTGHKKLSPYAPECLPLGAPGFRAYGRLSGLACYSGRDYGAEAIVSCAPAMAEEPVAGPDWLGENYACTAGGDFKLRLSTAVAIGWFGTRRPTETTSGVFEVRGHYDDAQSASCRFTVSVTPMPPEPLRDQQAVTACREEFIVTRLDPLPITDMLNMAMDFDLWVECANKSVGFAGERWVANPESYAHWQPFDASLEEGWIEPLSAEQARFMGHGGDELLLDRIDDPSVPMCGP